MVKENFSIGLTGGIACGKSTLAEGLRARGAEFVTVDQLADPELPIGISAEPDSPA